MKKNDYVLRNERIKKWVLARKGRISLLSIMLNKDRGNLHVMIFKNRLSPELILDIEQKQTEIEGLERDCIKQFPFFKRFIMKSEGRVGKLSEKLNISCEVLRGLARAKGDSRYRLIKYGVSRIYEAMRECENERKATSYSTEKIDVKAYVTSTVKKSHHSLDDLINLVGVIKENADFGNHDAAVIFREVGEGRYKVVSIGFDTVFTGMCKSHICEKQNPHLHATMFAAVGVPKNTTDSTGQLMLISHSAPCQNCATRLLNTGIRKAYCFFEPELMGGLNLLARHDVPVIKINLYNKTQQQINSTQDAA